MPVCEPLNNMKKWMPALEPMVWLWSSVVSAIFCARSGQWS